MRLYGSEIDGRPLRRMVTIRPVRARRLRTAMAALLLLSVWSSLALLAPSADAAATAPGDSSRPVAGVRVTREGIEVLEEGEARKVDPETRGKDGSRNVRVGPGGVHVTINDGSEQVYVRGPAIVVDADDGTLVRVFADVTVDAGEKVEGDVVAVFGTARIDGEVAGTVVSVMGSVILGENARVYGDAVSVGGILQMDPSATVSGETVSVGFLPIGLNTGLPTLPALLLAIFVAFAVSFLAGWILFLAAPATMRRTADAVTRRTGASLLVGLVMPPLVIITIGLLFITVIGIPGAFLLPVLYGLVLWAGYIAASYVLGCKLVRHDVENGPVWALGAGLAFVAVFFVVGALLASVPGVTRQIALVMGLLGVMLTIVLSAIGSGGFVLGMLGARNRRRGAGETVPPAGASVPASPTA